MFDTTVSGYSMQSAAANVTPPRDLEYLSVRISELHSNLTELSGALYETRARLIGHQPETAAGDHPPTPQHDALVPRLHFQLDELSNVLKDCTFLAAQIRSA